MKHQLSNIYTIASFLVIGGLLQGFDISSISGIIGSKVWQNYYGHPDASTQGGITASISGGSFLGCYVNMFTIDRFGRRTSMQIGCVIFIIGAIITATSVDIAMLIFGRILCGLAVGMFTSTGPTYLAELAPREVRGRILSLQQWSITWGAMIMYYITYGTSFTGSTAAFRVPWSIQAFPALVLFTALFFVPRSPRWLASQDRLDEAIQVLALIHGNGNSDSSLVQAEIAEIKASMNVSRAQGNIRWAELFQRENVKRILCGVFVHVWTQLSGNNAVLYYVTYIMEMAGLTGNINLIASSIQYVVNVIFTLPAILFLDRTGRRPSLLIGSTLMAGWLYAIAGTMATYGHIVPQGVHGSKVVYWTMNDDAPHAKGAIIACTYLLVATYSSTWAPISWCYPTELYPVRLRGKAVSLATSANWIFGFANSYYSPPAYRNTKWRVFLIFGTFNVVAGIQAFFFFPETKGLSLEDVDELFASGVKAWRTKSYNADRLTELVEMADSGKLGAKNMEVGYA